MKANNISDEHLLDYIDDSLSPEDKKVLEAIIKDDHEVKHRLSELKQIDNILSKTKLKQPSGRFAFDVMKSIEHVPHGVKKGGLLIVIGAIFTVLLGAYYTVGDMISLSILQQTDYLPSLTQHIPEAINLKTLNSLLLFTLSVFSLLIFDKTVLRPIFKKRKYHY